MDDPEVFWSSMLSRDAEKIRAAWAMLTDEEKAAVRAHLTRMVTEEDWAEPQRRSAQTALNTLDTEHH